MSNKKKIVSLQQLLVPVICVVIGGLCGFFAPSFIDRTIVNQGITENRLLDCGLVLLVFLVVFFFQTIIHEGGHLLFGLLSGYSFSSFRVGPFMLMKQGKEYCLRRMKLTGTGGQCLLTPPDLKDGKIPFALYNLGGSLLNLISAVLCFLLYIPFRAHPVISVFLIINVFVGVIYALLNGIPLNTGMVTNDGHNAVSMKKDPAALRAFWLQLKLSALLTEGVRLKDMPEDWFRFPEGRELNNAMTASIGVFACNRMLDAHQFPQAREAMESLLRDSSALLGIHRSLLVNDLVFCALREGEVEKANSMLTKAQKKFMRSMKSYPSILRTEYAYALVAEKDEAKAGQIREKFRKLSHSYPYPSELASETELFDLATGDPDL